jgi:hypothetical protein
MIGPVELSISFYRLPTGGEPIGPTLDIGSVDLVQGVFTVDLKLTPGDIDTVFSNGADLIYVQVTAAGKTYPRQRLLPVPLALRVPVDNSTVEFNTSGLLGVKSIPISKVEGLSGILGTSVALKGAAGSTMDGYLSKDDWQRFEGKQDKITASSNLSAASLTTSSEKAITLDPYGLSPGNTGEIRFSELSANGQNYVGFKAPDNLPASLVWTLPTTLGTSGQILSTNSSGNLSWVTPRSGTVTQISTGPGLVGGPITMSGQISLAETTVIPGYYPRANISVDAHGRITAASQGSDIDLTGEVFGTLPINRGGTGTAVTPTNGQLLIGNGTGYSLATLTAGTGMIVTNTPGGIKIDASEDPATKVNKSGDTMTGSLMVGGNVGIGTTSPNYQLDVDGTASFGGGIFVGPALSSNANIEIGNSTGAATTPYIDFHFGTGSPQDWNARIINSGNNRLDFVTTSAALTINGGNVGIGTTAPTAKLDINGTIKVPAGTNTVIKSDANDSGTSSSDGFRIRQDGGFFGTNTDALVIEKTDGNQTNPDGGIAFVNTGSTGVSVTALTIRGTGNVGIGTTSPTARLMVAGGQAVSAYSTTTSSTIDWNDGNIQNSSAAAGTVTLNSMIDGGVYTLILSNSSGGSYTFSAAGITFRCKPSCPVLVTAGSWTVVTVLKAGSNALLSWGGGYQ